MKTPSPDAVPHHPFKHFLSGAVCIFLVVFISQTVQGKQISFYVPQDYEKYQLIDSLYSLIDSLDRVVIQLESALIKDKAIRKDNLVVKEQYFNYLLNNKIKTRENILTYCKTVETYSAVKMKYFDELLLTLKDNDRAQCFVLWKNSRTEHTQISDIINKFDVSNLNTQAIDYSMDEKAENKLDIQEPSVTDILGDDMVGSTEDEENPYASKSSPVVKLERDVESGSGSTVTQSNKNSRSAQKQSLKVSEEKKATPIKKGAREKDI